MSDTANTMPNDVPAFDEEKAYRQGAIAALEEAREEILKLNGIYYVPGEQERIITKLIKKYKETP